MSISEKFKNSLKNRLGHDAVSFLSHGKNYVGADLFAKGLSFISIPIFTRLLVPSDYGKVALFLSIVSVLAIVFGWGIRGAVSRYYYESTNDFNRFIPSNIVFLLIVDTILIVFLYLFRHQITSTFSFSPDLYYFALAVAMMQSIFQLYQAYLIVSKQSKSVAKLNVFHSTGVIVISIILILMMDNNRYLGKIYGSTIAIVLLFIYSSYKLIVLSEWKLNIKYVKYSLIFGIPVVFHLISQYVLSTFDRMIINQLVDEKATGLYSFAYQVGMLINIVYMGMLKSWTPIFYEKLKAKDYAGIESLSRKYALIVTMLAVLLILFSKEIVIIMADSSYYESLNLIPVIIIGYMFFFYYTMYVNYAFYEKKTYLISIFTIIAGGINIGLNYLWIPQYGYSAAAWTTLVSYLILFLLHYLNVRFIIKFSSINSIGKYFIDLIPIVMSGYLLYWINTHEMSYLIQFLIKITFVSAFAAIYIIYRLRENGFKRVN